MKLLIAMPHGSRLGGAENALLTLLRHLDRSRVEPVVVFNQPGDLQVELAGLGIPTLFVPLGRMRHLWSGLRAVLEMARCLRRERPDLVLSWMDRAHFYMAPAAAMVGMTERLIWWQHTLPDRRYWSHRLVTLLPASAIGCPSHAVARRQLVLWPKRQTFVVHPGVQSGRKPDSSDRLAARERLGIPVQRKVVGIVGRIDHWKGHDLLLRAMAELRRRGHDIHGLVVGGDAYVAVPGYHAYLSRLTAELDLLDRVTFTGHVSDPSSCFQAMDVLVNASGEEPFGLTLIEAMSIGLAVVASNAAGPAEIIEHDVSGILVAPGQMPALANALERLICDTQLRQRLGDEGIRRQRRLFSTERMTDAFVRSLEDVWAKAGSGLLARA